MALALLDGELTWQKVFHQLSHQDASSAIVEQFKAFREYMTGAKKNPSLQLIPFNDTQITTDTGYSPIGGVTSTVFAFYVKKRATATDAFVRLYNDTTNTTIGNAYVGVNLMVASDDFASFYPKGQIYATDLTISSDTASGGGTESTAGDSGDGFVLVGA